MDRKSSFCRRVGHPKCVGKVGNRRLSVHGKLGAFFTLSGGLATAMVIRPSEKTNTRMMKSWLFRMPALRMRISPRPYRFEDDLLTRSNEAQVVLVNDDTDAYKLKKCLPMAW